MWSKRRMWWGRRKETNQRKKPSKRETLEERRSYCPGEVSLWVEDTSEWLNLSSSSLLLFLLLLHLLSSLHSCWSKHNKQTKKLLFDNLAKRIAAFFLPYIHEKMFCSGSAEFFLHDFTERTTKMSFIIETVDYFCLFPGFCCHWRRSLLCRVTPTDVPAPNLSVHTHGRATVW